MPEDSTLSSDSDENHHRTVRMSNSIPESTEGFLELPLNSVPYREYMETGPQYIPGHGISRYMPSLKNLIPVRKSKMTKGTINVDKAGLFSYIFYTWLSPFIYKAYRKGLTADDIPSGSPLESCDLNSQRLELFWQKEVAEKGISDASFGRVVWRFIRTRIFASSFLFCMNLSMGFISPAIFMRQLLQYAQNEQASTTEGVMWALCLTFTEFMRLLFIAWYWGTSYRTGIRLRSACVALLYRKVLRLNGLGDKSIGELINIFAIDTQRIYDMVLFGPMIIGGPLVTVFGVFYIYWLLGGWALFGMAAFLLFYPTQYGISRLTSYLRSRTIVITDKRVKVMTEVLNSIKFIKMYAWEKFFSSCIKEIRSNEHKLLQNTSYCQSLSMSLAHTVPVISAVITFLAHISTGNNLSAAQAFPVFTYCAKQVRSAMNEARDSTLSLYEASISLMRFKRILCMEEIIPYIVHPIDKSEAINIVGGSFAYNTPPTNNPPTSDGKSALSQEPEAECLNTTDRKYVTVLHDICFEASKGKLIGICGPVGSGKTSLILACLGQMKKLGGQVMRDGSCAYVSQEAWILNTTLKENILFGERFNSKRYYEAIYACSLTEDINMLPGGDQTEIGEKGINLSGGQKQRVALARALYSNKEIYFLDDPLSAVDAHVGAEIFQRYLMTSLKGKTIIFVTHQMQYLSNCDDIYMLKDGHVIEHGSHIDLMKEDGEYANMLKTCLMEKEKKTQTSFEDQATSGDGVGKKDLSNTNKTLQEKKTSPVKDDQMMVPERIEKGQIKFYTYHSYIMAAGGYIVAAFVFLTFLVNVGSSTFSSWWLATWIKEGGGSTEVLVNNHTQKSDQLIDNPDFPMYRMVYGITVVVILGTSFLKGYVFTKATLHASTKIHNKLFNKIINCPMLFFETTPIGRIQNLFAKDMDEVDVRLPVTVESIIQNLLIVIFAILLICLVFPWFIIPMTFLGGMYYFMSKVFRVVIRDLKRFENVSRSPIFSWIGTTVQGLNTIHAFEKENEYIRRFTSMYDENSTCLYLCSVAGRWLAIRMDKLAVMITCITAFLVIILHGQVPPAMAGLALAYSAHISGLFQYTIRLISDTEVRFISVERINSYLQNVVCEGNGSPKVHPPLGWPSKGSIRFQNVSLAYRKGLPDVLNNITFSISAGEKVGIVGRTGSGKSSLIVALFRLVELSAGQIKIDGIDIADISLEELRSRLTVIPQDPVLFAGTVRSNLDPHQLFSDAELWSALEKTTLKSKIAGTTDQLDSRVNASGNNFSVGERQLLCLARALLKNTKILILDEATAAVDPETEVAIQTAIQNEFLHCTVLTIAHRLSTVTTSNRVLVMDNGKVVEFDSPSNLLADYNSHFYQLWSSAENAVHHALLNVPRS